jgi:hypothetical protein
MIDAGQAPAEFDVVARDGSAITSATNTGPHLVAFLSPQCDLCHEQLPSFIDYAQRFPGGRNATTAVVIGPPEESERLAARLEPVTRVVFEESGGAMYTAFGVQGFPAYAVVEEGVVRASGYRVESLPAAALAT